ncbi:aromatic ring-hydroxylating oxygenase subunit alpha [Pseudoroseicyclus tamaricis]|uniref:Rieske 2Fe-2S domain-containing protein n=1 Tax=Pseudoroseicyclus tamaricis TaxID=2705421 RepID=A0A6B2K5A6_9RHOB|nr:SRPBCC family protein [Pseudoroseicyclus tamaricis]NDV01936.1 Rieske 2Fe-2S domain-containing protein [Pseudoroseicyclus tamaricis]
MKDSPSQPAALEELRATLAAPFEEGRAMPKSLYTSPEVLALEQERLFAREWVSAGRASRLAVPGDYLTMEIAGEPVIVLRDREGRLHALSNVCRHRMALLLEGEGNTRTITCPYHAWSYNLDGTLRGAPGMGRNAAFSREGIALPEIACQEWKGWIMLCLDPQTPPPSERLGALDDLIGHYRMEDYVELFHETFRWKTNWKVLGENFMESYHLPACHAGTIGGAVDLEEMTCPPGEEGFNYHWILKDETARLALAHDKNTWLTGEDRRKTWLVSIYPSLFITLTPGYFWYLSLTPVAPGEVDVLYGGGLAPEFLGETEAEENFTALKTLLDEVNMEDKACTEAVYRGLSSRLGAPGPLSHLERPNWDFARYILSRLTD